MTSRKIFRFTASDVDVDLKIVHLFWMIVCNENSQKWVETTLATRSLCYFWSCFDSKITCSLALHSAQSTLYGENKINLKLYPKPVVVQH